MRNMRLVLLVFGRADEANETAACRPSWLKRAHRILTRLGVASETSVAKVAQRSSQVHEILGARKLVRMRRLIGKRQVRRSRASASISTFISGFRSADTTTIVAAGRIAPKTSPCTVTTDSQ